MLRDGQHTLRVTRVVFLAWLNSLVAKRGAEVSLSLHIVVLLELKELLSSPPSPPSLLFYLLLLSQIFQSGAKSRSLLLSPSFFPQLPTITLLFYHLGGQKFMIFHFGGGESGREQPVMSHVAALESQLEQ